MKNRTGSAKDMIVVAVVVTVVSLFVINGVEGRPSKHPNPHKGEETRQGTQRPTGITKDIDPESIRESIAMLSSRPGPGETDQDPEKHPSLANFSFMACTQACINESTSVNKIHSCHRECMIDPHKYGEDRNPNEIEGTVELTESDDIDNSPPSPANEISDSDSTDITIG